MCTQRWFSSVLILASLFLASCTAQASTPSPTPFHSDYSPNSEWALNWIKLQQGCGDTLIIQNVEDKGLRWILPEQAAHDNYTEALLIYTFHWSIDGTYFYFMTSDCGEIFLPIFWGYSSLKRLDLSSGEIIQLLPPDDTTARVFAEISSDSKYLAYLEDYTLTIRDLTTWEERAVTTKLPISESAGNILSTGGITWSPDNTKLVYGVITGSTEDYHFNLSLIFVDAVNMKSKLLIGNFAQGYDSVDWLNNEEIRVKAWLKDEGPESILILINTTTGEITELEN